jgi:hypothetical protein
VTLRQLPGALVLGLVTALVSHAVLFGGEHAWGGNYHSFFLQFTLAAIVGLMAATGALLWSGAHYAADGTVLAGRMRDMLPRWIAVAISGAGWYALGEILEAPHAGVPFLAIVAILALTAWLLRRCASSALRALASFVFAIAIALATPCRRELIRRLEIPAALRQAQRDTVWCRRFSRPPPVTANA